MRLFRIVMALVLVACALPFLSVLLAGAVASLGGCDVDEGSVHPCRIAGHDVGEALYAMFVSGWLGLLTLPVLIGAVVLWIVVEIVHWLRCREARAL